MQIEMIELFIDINYASKIWLTDPKYMIIFLELHFTTMVVLFASKRPAIQNLWYVGHIRPVGLLFWIRCIVIILILLFLYSLID